MDGVLVDVRGSFLSAVKRAVQHAVLTETGVRDDAALVDDEVIAAFKGAGGWNNDWDLAHGLALWFVESAAGAHSAAEVRAKAGDPGAAARVTLRARAARLPRPTFEDVKSLMLELYWGSADALRRFDVRPRLDVREPLLAAERVLLHTDTVQALRALGITRFGVITGRLLVEWEAIRARVPLPAQTLVATDEDGRKPDPMLLRRLVERLGSKRPCYVGDVMDDWALVRAYNMRFADAPATGVLVATEPLEEAAFRNAGAKFVIGDVNELPALIAGT